MFESQGVIEIASDTSRAEHPTFREVEPYLHGDPFLPTKHSNAMRTQKGG